jgi:hypothetical protein
MWVVNLPNKDDRPDLAGSLPDDVPRVRGVAA